MKCTTVAALILCSCLFSLAAEAAPHLRETRLLEVRAAGPPALEYLSFDELVALSSTATPSGPLAVHLDNVLNTPIVQNNSGALPPHRPVVKNLGPILRLATWNIERGLNFEQIKLALTDPEAFRRTAGDFDQRSDRQRNLVESQLAALQDADVPVLNEVDLGMKRTDYRDVARELAAALHMNYAYGVEFVEVDPVFEMGTEEVDLPDSQDNARLHDDLRVDRGKYRGLHGTAILSRYPIRNARILRLPLCYDWYEKEADAISNLERGRRWTSDKLFRERIGRELRRGGRMALIADLAIPELPTGAATVVAVHLENRCSPGCRRTQVKALLEQMKEDRNPVVMAGDFNTSARDNTPTSIRYEIMNRVSDYKFWINQVAAHFHPMGLFQYALVPVHYLHGYHDPTAFNVPIFWENRERGFFQTIRRFRSAGGDRFDFRGEPGQSLQGRGRTLSNSNERAAKGFVPTYSFNRNYGGLVGEFKLDWIFVKPAADDPRSNPRSDRFAPRFAMTMSELNQAPANRISDHPPLTVDLPLQ